MLAGFFLSGTSPIIKAESLLGSFHCAYTFPLHDAEHMKIPDACVTRSTLAIMVALLTCVLATGASAQEQKPHDEDASGEDASSGEITLFEGGSPADAPVEGLTVESTTSQGGSASSEHLAAVAGGTLRLEFERGMGSILVKAQLGRRPVYFVFDTGATITTLTPEVAASLGIRPKEGAPMTVVRTANGPRATAFSIIPTLTLGGRAHNRVTFSECPSCGGDVPGLKYPIAGLLGMNVLGRYMVRIDESAGVVELIPNTRHSERLADIKPWVEVGANGRMERQGNSSEMVLYYDVALRNRSRFDVREVVVSLTCQTKDGGSEVVRTEPVTVRARQEKTMAVRTSFGQRCVRTAARMERARW